MSWIQTYSGKLIYPLKLTDDQVDIVDIAHALANLCRFNGHCRKFYSVAEHCLRVCALLPDDLQLWGLLHDAAEAYTGDIIDPIKRRLELDKLPYFVYEDEIMVVIARRFGLVLPCPLVVNHVDKILLATETRDLMKRPSNPSESLPAPLVDKLCEILSSELAEQAFLKRFEELTS